MDAWDDIITFELLPFFFLLFVRGAAIRVLTNTAELGALNTIASGERDITLRCVARAAADPNDLRGRGAVRRGDDPEVKPQEEKTQESRVSTSWYKRNDATSSRRGRSEKPTPYPGRLYAESVARPANSPLIRRVRNTRRTSPRLLRIR